MTHAAEGAWSLTRGLRLLLLLPLLLLHLTGPNSSDTSTTKIHHLRLGLRPLVLL